jgi:hypothetical protein
LKHPLGEEVMGQEILVEKDGKKTENRLDWRLHNAAEVFLSTLFFVTATTSYFSSFQPSSSIAAASTFGDVSFLFHPMENYPNRFSMLREIRTMQTREDRRSKI